MLETVPSTQPTVEEAPAGVEVVPQWFKDRFGGMSYDQLCAAVGGNIEELPYPILNALLPDGSNDSRIVDVLRSKKAGEQKTSGVVTEVKPMITGYNGTVVNEEDFNKLPDEERAAFLHGTN